MKNKLLLLIVLLIFTTVISCSTNKHVIVLAFSKQLHAVLYNDNNEYVKTASKTYTEEEKIVNVANLAKSSEEKYTAETNDIEMEQEAAIINAEISDTNKELEQQETIIINNEYNKVLLTHNIIEFDFDSYELKEEYDEGIEEIYKYLNSNNFNLIIEGHSDNTGDSNYNIYLSENRAKTIFDKLIEKGIERERLRYIGYGSSHSDYYNAKDRKCQFVIINNDKEEAIYKNKNENDIIKLRN